MVDYLARYHDVGRALLVAVVEAGGVDQDHFSESALLDFLRDGGGGAACFEALLDIEVLLDILAESLLEVEHQIVRRGRFTVADLADEEQMSLELATFPIGDRLTQRVDASQALGEVVDEEGALELQACVCLLYQLLECEEILIDVHLGGVD